MKPLRAVLVGLRTDLRRRQPPLAAAALKAYALSVPGLRGEARVVIVEGWAGEKPKRLCSRILREAPGLVGFSCYVWNIETVAAVCRALRARAPGTRIVLGGPEVSARAQDALQDIPADAVVRGEGEETFAEVLKAAAAGRGWEGIAGLVWRSNGSSASGPERAPIKDLGRLPSPYLTGLLRPGPGSEVPIEVSRGCRFHCRFCTWGGLGERALPAARVERELRSLQGKEVFVQLVGADVLCGLRGARLLKLLLGPARGRHGPVVSLETHLGHWRGAVPAAFDSDRLHLFAGVQTTSPEALRLSGRFFDRAANERTLRALRRRAPRASVHLELILGLPGDTSEGFRATLDWALSQEPATVLVYRLLLLPGSDFRACAPELGVLWDPRPPYPVISVPGFSADEITGAHCLAWAVSVLRCDPALRRGLDALGRARARTRPLPRLSAYEDLLKQAERGLSGHYHRTGARALTSFDAILWADRAAPASARQGAPAWLTLSAPLRHRLLDALAGLLRREARP